MPRGGKGYLYWEDQLTGQKVEMPTLTCAHCNRIVVQNPKRVRPREWCFKCDAYVCDLKFCIEECNPIVQSVELAQNNNGDDAYLLRGKNGEILFDPRKRDERKVY